MKILTRLAFVMALFTLISLAKTPTAEAQYYPYPGVYYHHTYYGQVPYGYGYYSIRTWPANYWGNIYYNGFSYLPYYNYQPRYATYGALSYSIKNDQGGYAWGYQNRDDAANAAVGYCNDDDCAPVAWVQGGCLAMATSAANGNVAWGYGDSKYRAKSAAMNSCRTSGAADCTYRSFVCSY